MMSDRCSNGAQRESTLKRSWFSRLLARKKNICEACDENFNRSYFQQIIAEFNLLTPEERELNSASREVVLQIFKEVESGKRAPTCDDIYTLEKALIQLQSMDKICLERDGLRDKYREVVGRDRYTSYLVVAGKLEEDARKKDSGQEKFRQTILSDINFIMSELHLKYTLLPFRENERTPVLKRIGIVLLFYYILLMVMSSISSSYFLPEAMLYCIITAFGTAGAYISLIQRLHAVPIFSDPVVSFLSLKYGRFSIYLTPISGAIFAVILYLLFVSKMLEGALFPQIKSSSMPQGEQLAKLLVWAFVAGFAERFVPDTLDRLIAQKLKSGDSTNNATV